MEKIYFNEVRERIKILEYLYTDLELISRDIRNELKTRGLNPIFEIVNHEVFTFVCGKYNAVVSKLVYDDRFFKFKIFIQGIEKNTVDTYFIEEMIKKYKLDSIYEKINRLLTYLSDVTEAIRDKIEKEKELEGIKVDFNPYTLEFNISTDETDGTYWHKIKINGIDFNIECGDDTLEFLLVLLNKEYIEK